MCLTEITDPRDQTGGHRNLLDQFLTAVLIVLRLIGRGCHQQHLKTVPFIAHHHVNRRHAICEAGQIGFGLGVVQFKRAGRGMVFDHLTVAAQLGPMGGSCTGQYRNGLERPSRPTGHPGAFADHDAKRHGDDLFGERIQALLPVGERGWRAGWLWANFRKAPDQRQAISVYTGAQWRFCRAFCGPSPTNRTACRGWRKNPWNHSDLLLQAHAGLLRRSNRVSA